MLQHPGRAQRSKKCCHAKEFAFQGVGHAQLKYFFQHVGQRLGSAGLALWRARRGARASREITGFAVCRLLLQRGARIHRARSYSHYVAGRGAAGPDLGPNVQDADPSNHLPPHFSDPSDQAQFEADKRQIYK